MKSNTLPTDGPDITFRENLSRGLFKIQKCENCTGFIYYPRMLCPHCGAAELSWHNAQGYGTVYSTSVPHGMPEGRYNISLVDLDEGPRMMTRVTGIPPEDVHIGMRVVAYIEHTKDASPLVLFRPDKHSQNKHSSNKSRINKSAKV